MKATTRAAIYARQSDTAGDPKGSIEDQVADCQKWALAHGYVVKIIYREQRSGVRGDTRPEFLRAVEAAKRGEYDVLVCLDVSRFSRGDVDEAGYWRYQLREAGVEIAFVLDGEALSGAAGDYVRPIMQVAAHDHSRKTSYKAVTGVLATMRGGYFPGGRAAYGYRRRRSPTYRGGKDRCETKLEVYEPEAAVVRRIYELFRAGSTYTGIATLLDGEGVPCPRAGTSWSHGAIDLILGNPIYAGDLVHGRHRTATFYCMTDVGVLPVEEAQDAPPVVMRDAAPPIVAREMWEAVQALAAARRRAPAIGGVPTPLTGLVYCVACGERMMATTVRKAAKAYCYCMCRPCKNTLDRARLEAVVLDGARVRVAGLDLEQLLADARKVLAGTPAPDWRKLEAKRRAGVQRAAALALEAASDELAREITARHRAEDERLSREIERARAGSLAELDVERALRAAAADLAAIDSMDLAQQRRALHLLVRRIEVEPAARRTPHPVRIHYRRPLALAFADRQGSQGFRASNVASR